MKSVILAVCVSLAMCSGATAVAKKPPVPPPNISASVAINLAVRGEQLPPSVPLYDESVSLSLSHSFQLTAQQEAALQPDAIIEILGISFALSEDPDFQSGDKSVSLEKSVSIGLGVTEQLPVTISAKWGNGKFTIKVKGSLKLKDIAPPAPPDTVIAAVLGIQSVEKATVSPRQIVPLETTIKHYSIPDLEVIAGLASDVEQTQTEGSTAEGATYVEQIVTAKSKFITPIP